MANNEASFRRNQQILARNPDLAALFAEREEDRAQLETYNQAQALGLEGHDLIREPDMTERRELALKYLAEANNVTDDLVKATAPQISPLLEHILSLRGTEGTAMSTVQKQKVDEIGTILDTNYKAFHELEKKIGDTALRTGPGRSALVKLKSDYFDPATGEIANPLGYAQALGAFFEAAPDPDQQAAGMAWLSGQTGVSIGDLKRAAQDGSGSWFGAAQGLDFTTNFNEIEQNAENLVGQRASRKQEVKAQWRALQGTYGGLTGDGRALLDELETALLNLDSDGLQRALGLQGIEDLPESEASKQLRQVVTDLIKPEEGVDYWMQDSEHIEKILAEPAFGQVAAEMGYEGQGLDVLRRVTQQYEGELGTRERANNVNDAYRIFELGQPAGSPGNYLKAATTVLFNRKEYNALKAEREGTSPREATQETSSLVNEIEGNLAEESGKPVEEVQATLAETRPDLEGMRNEAAAKAIPESAEAQPPPGTAEASPVWGGDVPSKGTVQAMQRVADSQGQPLPIGQSGFFVQPGQEGKLFQPAEGREGELVEYVPPVAPEEGKIPWTDVFSAGSPAVEEGGEVKTGTDGWADYELDPDGTIRFTQKSNGREVTVSKNQPGAYYSILEDVFGETIPSRMKPVVAAAKARLASPPAEEEVVVGADEGTDEGTEDDTPDDAEKERRREEARERARKARDRRRAEKAAKEAGPAEAVPEVVEEEEEESSLDFSQIPGVEEEEEGLEASEGRLAANRRLDEIEAATDDQLGEWAGWRFRGPEDVSFDRNKMHKDGRMVAAARRELEKRGVGRHSANLPEHNTSATEEDFREDRAANFPGDVEAPSKLTKLINSALSESLPEGEEEPGESAQESDTTKRIREGGGVNQQLDKQRAAQNAPPEPPPEQETSEPSREETSEPPKEEPPQQSEPDTEPPGQSLQPLDAPKEAPHQIPGQSTRVGPTSFESLSLPAATPITTSAKVAATPGLSQAVDSPKESNRAAKKAKRIAAVLASAKEKAPLPGGSAIGGPN